MDQLTKILSQWNLIHHNQNQTKKKKNILISEHKTVFFLLFRHFVVTNRNGNSRDFSFNERIQKNKR